jgi:hypothetical protein
MLKVLEAERENQGSGWSDMYFRVKKWLGEIESAKTVESQNEKKRVE